MKYGLHLGKLVMLCALTLLFGSPARAQLVLIINDSNLSDVTFTATGANAAHNDSTTNEDNGVDMLSFFTSPYATQGTLNTGFFGTQSLTPSGSGTIPYDIFYADDFSGTTSDLDMFIAPTITQVFSTGTSAFTGVMAGDFTTYSALMPANGATGTMLAGYSGLHGATLGTWQVENVPEPATFGLLAAVAALGAATWRKRRV